MNIELFEKTLKKLYIDRKYSQRKLCAEIGMTETGFSKMLVNNSIKVETLEQIAKVLKVPIATFFDESDGSPVQYTEIEHLVDNAKKVEEQGGVYGKEELLKRIAALEKQVLELQTELLDLYRKTKNF